MADPAGARLQSTGLHFARGRQPVLAGVSLGIDPGEVVALLGPNGAGKTTLLRLMLGLLRPDRGTVRLDGRPLASFARRTLAQHLAYVPQQHQPPFPYRVREVVELGRLSVNGLFAAPRPADAAAVDRVLDCLGIAHLAGRIYTRLSGGERQLVMIGRALAQGATLLVMDEPTGGLDYGHQMRLLERLRGLAAGGSAILLSTHHPDHARQVATRVAILRDGRIDADGTPERVLTGATIRRLYGL